MNVQNPNDEHPQIDDAGGPANAERGFGAAQNAAKGMEFFAAFCAILRAFGKYFSLDCPHNHWRREVLQMEGDATPCNAF